MMKVTKVHTSQGSHVSHKDKTNVNMGRNSEMGHILIKYAGSNSPLTNSKICQTVEILVRLNNLLIVLNK